MELVPVFIICMRRVEASKVGGATEHCPSIWSYPAALFARVRHLRLRVAGLVARITAKYDARWRRDGIPTSNNNKHANFSKKIARKSKD